MGSDDHSAVTSDIRILWTIRYSDYRIVRVSEGREQTKPARGALIGGLDEKGAARATLPVGRRFFPIRVESDAYPAKRRPTPDGRYCLAAAFVSCGLAVCRGRSRWPRQEGAAPPASASGSSASRISGSAGLDQWVGGAWISGSGEQRTKEPYQNRPLKRW